MKKLIILILAVAFLMTACGPSDRDKSQMLDTYFKSSSMYEVTISYDSVGYDSVYQVSARMLVIAADIYEANRLMESTIEQYNADYSNVGFVMQNTWFYKYQSYPYLKYR